MFERKVPALRRPLNAIRAKGWWVVRVPVAFFFIIGGILAILPVFGVWMLPIGFLLLAVDITALRGPLADAIVRGRRRIALWRRRR
ncbi:hypothetical protein thalar_00036 [Litoreibacter arenae DSM 19593]|uniref:Uncharacterized protein n=2 Tax=Litoreibacter TaxID=947567 RepID=S9QJ55_9RHOB|nr:hypothetical protein thalar_00036 [Litoreibacter arenae DSM 19593]